MSNTAGVLREIEAAYICRYLDSSLFLLARSVTVLLIFFLSSVGFFCLCVLCPMLPVSILDCSFSFLRRLFTFFIFLLVIVFSVLQFKVSDYPFGIFKLF